jgi:hypothetical protein
MRQTGIRWEANEVDLRMAVLLALSHQPEQPPSGLAEA